jgi:hypothetical protein
MLHALQKHCKIDIIQFYIADGQTDRHPPTVDWE